MSAPRHGRTRTGGRARWAIAKREWRGILQERTILLALGVQVVVAGFSGVLATGFEALLDPGATHTNSEPLVAVNGTALPHDLEARLLAANVRLQREPDDARAWALFRAGQADAVLLVHGEEPMNVTLGLPDGDLRAAITLARLKAALQVEEQSLRDARAARLLVVPVRFDTQASGQAYEFTHALLVPLLVFLPVVLAGALIADALTEEVQRGTWALLLSTPATPAAVVEGKLLAHGSLALLLGAAWLGLLGLNGNPMAPQAVLAILALVGASTLLMGALGTWLALGARDRNRAHLLYATTFLLLLALTTLLPVTPVNLVARLSAGSADARAYAIVGALSVAALATWLGFRVWLDARGTARLAAQA